MTTIYPEPTGATASSDGVPPTEMTPGSPGSGEPPHSRTLRRVLLAVGSVVLLWMVTGLVVNTVIPATQQDAGPQQESLDATSRVTVQASAADITVRQGETDSIEVFFDPRSTAYRAVSRNDGDTLRVEVQRPGPVWTRWLLSDFSWQKPTLIVSLPRGGMTSYLDVSASHGEIDVTAEVGELAVNASSGHVWVQGSAEHATVRASSGNVQLSQMSVSGELAVRASSGDITLSLETLPESIDVAASSGDIEATFPRGLYRVDAQTSSGSTIVQVPTDPQAERLYRFTASSGDIAVWQQ